MDIFSLMSRKKIAQGIRVLNSITSAQECDATAAKQQQYCRLQKENHETLFH